MGLDWSVVGLYDFTGDNKTRVWYDGDGNRIKLRDPSVGIEEYKFNGFGEMYWKKDGRDLITTYKYDELGRKVEENRPEGTDKWSYDSRNKAKGKLTRHERFRRRKIQNFFS